MSRSPERKLSSLPYMNTQVPILYHCKFLLMSQFLQFKPISLAQSLVEAESLGRQEHVWFIQHCSFLGPQSKDEKGTK